MESPRLVVPSAPHKDSYRTLVAEFVACGEPLIPFPLSFPHENFEAFLAQLAGCERGIGIPEGFVPHSTFWLMRGEDIVGVSNLRHRLNDKLRIEGSQRRLRHPPLRPRAGVGHRDPAAHAWRGGAAWHRARPAHLRPKEPRRRQPSSPPTGASSSRNRSSRRVARWCSAGQSRSPARVGPRPSAG